jgi:steroid 5-alpha reductase family enzyme
MVTLNWQVCLPLVSLILMVMSFSSIRTTEAKMLARANNFRLRD